MSSEERFRTQGGSRPAPNATDAVVGSVVTGDNAALLRHVTALWVPPGATVLDVTYGRGSFWRWDHPYNIVGHDLATDGVDFRALPEADASVDVLVFDPPYRPRHDGTPNADHAARFGLADAPGTMADVLALYAAGLKEAARVVRTDGIALVKCQDMTYNHALHLVTVDVLAVAHDAGFTFVDQVILNAGSTGPRRGRQERFARTHSVIWVMVR